MIYIFVLPGASRNPRGAAETWSEASGLPAIQGILLKVSNQDYQGYRGYCSRLVTMITRDTGDIAQG